MKIADIISTLNSLAPNSLQEDYDNAGLLTGHPTWICSGILCALDVTDKIIDEAVGKGANLIVTHHPIIFKGLKRIDPDDFVGRAIVNAIKNDIAIYAIHTNLDNVLAGVSGRMGKLLNLTHIEILSPTPGKLEKLYSFVPVDHAKSLMRALFAAGAGEIGRYSECSFSVEGIGTFKASAGTDPFVGEVDKQHQEKELKIELLYPNFLRSQVIKALKANHPYEEVAFDIISLENDHPGIGAGIIGTLPKPLPEIEFLGLIKIAFNIPVIRHTSLRNKLVSRVALCGGAGSFLQATAAKMGADAYLSADFKYHEFFEADGKILVADIGHYESEQYTIDLLAEFLGEKFPNFAVLKTGANTNPVHYF